MNGLTITEYMGQRTIGIKLFDLSDTISYEECDEFIDEIFKSPEKIEQQNRILYRFITFKNIEYNILKQLQKYILYKYPTVYLNCCITSIV